MTLFETLIFPVFYYCWILLARSIFVEEIKCHCKHLKNFQQIEQYQLRQTVTVAVNKTNRQRLRNVGTLNLNVIGSTTSKRTIRSLSQTSICSIKCLARFIFIHFGHSSCLFHAQTILLWMANFQSVHFIHLPWENAFVYGEIDSKKKHTVCTQQKYNEMIGKKNTRQEKKSHCDYATKHRRSLSVTFS